MGFFKGIQYNLRGLRLSLKTPRLLMLGLLRFLISLIVWIACVIIVLAYQSEMMNMIWTQPTNPWIVWIWYLIDGLVTLILIGLTAILSYLLSQVIFNVWIMDRMAQITEQLITGEVRQPTDTAWLKQLGYLIGQEIPRSLFPISLTLMISILGWLTPLGPIFTLVSSALACLFLAWDNTDVIPARQLKPFRERVRLLTGDIPFHLGFGILFLIPLVNIIFLSFAPVGAALYHCEKRKAH